MVYADANILIRYIVNDDEEMAGKAESLPHTALLEKRRFFPLIGS
jgi:hypothetical protein